MIYSDSATFTAVNTCDKYNYKAKLTVVAVSIILTETNPDNVVIQTLCEVAIYVVIKLKYLYVIHCRAILMLYLTIISTEN